MRALYWQRPTAAQQSAAGLCAEDFPAPEVGLWPENWPPIQLFLRISTQWRVGAGGAVGLDYNVLFHELDRAKLGDDAYDDLFAAIQLIEQTALEELYKE
ncbi:DUF1799 domain-containing protein [Dyella marensis]|uniref:DUF1799 domain-containing protein n=1 Tax=Dyella marensis TaxID=500610 RepID=A0A1I1ZX58_9GAMM|nr:MULTISPECIES: DUF1799 domain-containing protein [Dyella]SFE36394.1 Phage related hypothetical protein [Dyella marensis]